MEHKDWARIQGNFSNLQTIRVQSDALSEASEAQIIELLQNNKHISGLEIPSTNKRFLCNVNSILPRLRVLALKEVSDHYSNYDCNMICFEDVIRFYFESKSIDVIPEGLGLRHIDYLNLNIRYEFRDEWIDFIANQVNDDLSELKITSLIKNKQLLAIAEKLPHLSKVHIESPLLFSAQDIASFIGKLAKLNSLKLAIQMTRTEHSKLDELLVASDAKWNTTYEPRLVNTQMKYYAHITIKR